MMDKVVVEIEGQQMGCLDPIPVLTDVNEAYDYSKAQTQNKEGLENQFITFRFVYSLKTSTMSLCIIYGKGGVWVAEPKSGAKVNISNSYGVAWEIQDDPSGIKNGDQWYPDAIGDYSDRLWAEHSWLAEKSDGMCFGPITDNGADILITFTDLLAIKGVIFNTYDTQSKTIDTMNRWYLKDARGRNPSHFDSATGISLREHPQKIDSIRFKTGCTCKV